MSANNGGYTRLEFSIPARGLIGYRGEFMTDTKGNGIMNTIFDGYAPYKGDIQYRKTGFPHRFRERRGRYLRSVQRPGARYPVHRTGRRRFTPVWSSARTRKAEDIELNVCKTKKLTNTRSSSADEALKLTPPKIMSLEQCLEFIDTDELLEVTPKTLRIRKKILDSMQRKRASFKNKNA